MMKKYVNKLQIDNYFKNGYKSKWYWFDIVLVFINMFRFYNV